VKNAAHTAHHDATLTLVLPVSHSTDRLAATVQEALALVPGSFSDFEIIIVDDASPPAAASTAHQLAAHHDAVMLLRHPRRRGYARALLNGMRSARGDYILSLDPQGPVSVRELARLLPYLPQYELVMGYRPQRQRPWWHIAGRLAQWLTNRLLRLDLYDMDCNLHLMHAALFERMGLLHAAEPLASGQLIHAELYARARRLNAACVQAAVYEHPRSQQHPPQTRQEWRQWKRWKRRGMWRSLLRLWRRQRRLPAAAVPAQRVRSFLWETVIIAAGLVALIRKAWPLVRRRSDAQEFSADNGSRKQL
jgi:glycosyltransferase involved in cell wall biosynthesis